MRVVIYEQSNAIQMKKKGKPIELLNMERMHYLRGGYAERQ
jgi:hypothetical protein